MSSNKFSACLEYGYNIMYVENFPLRHLSGLVLEHSGSEGLAEESNHANHVKFELFELVQLTSDLELSYSF